MFKIFLRDDKQRIYRSLATSEKYQAMEAFNTLVYRMDLDGQKIVAIFKYNDTYIAFHRFDVPADHKHHLRGKTKAIYQSIFLI